MRLVKILWAMLAAAICMSAASAQTAYPDPRHPIRVIVGFAAGGGADASARLITRKMGELLHTNFIIDNRGGAGGVVATAAAAEAKPDGYTLLWGSIGAFAFSPALGVPISFDPLHDFEPISLTASLSNVLVVGASSAHKTLADLIAAARANPGKLSFGTPGIGSAGHISARLLLDLAKLDMVHVPYRGGSQLVTDVISGNVTAGVVTVSTVQTLGKDALLPLAVTTAQRDPALPNVPTFAEAGVKGYAANFWFGLLAPKGTPRDIVDKLNAAARTALADPAVSKAHLALGFSGTGSTPDEFAHVIDSDYHKWAKVLAKERIKN
jgi:tripartite-type tricarboxylate transporter receptor subunit TctC